MNNIIQCTEKDLDVLYDDWSLTFTGATIDDANLNWLKNWLKKHNCEMLREDFYVVTGELMNRKYHLTGTNVYPDNYNILCIKLTDLSNVNAIAISRFDIKGRWFTDVVDNIVRHENE